jgi:hypothetical protein
MLSRQSNWPPNLPEFRQLCRRDWRAQAHQYFEYAPALENLAEKARKLKERKASLAKLREETGL